MPRSVRSGLNTTLYAPVATETVVPGAPDAGVRQAHGPCAYARPALTASADAATATSEAARRGTIAVDATPQTRASATAAPACGRPGRFRAGCPRCRETKDAYEQYLDNRERLVDGEYEYDEAEYGEEEAEEGIYETDTLLGTVDAKQVGDTVEIWPSGEWIIESLRIEGGATTAVRLRRPA